jgi:mono/diheme cytochrome c family protein
MATPSKGNEAEGKKIFVVKCVLCHKADGSGGFKLTGNATPDWRNPVLMASPAHNDDALRDCITNGKPKSGMVAWVGSGQIKPAQVDDLIAYIRTFSRRK